MSKGYSGLFHGTFGTTIKNGIGSETYSDRGIDIPEYIKKTLSKLTKAGDKISGKVGSFPIEDVSIMSKETGVEFARVTIGDEEILIRGHQKGTTIPYSVLNRLGREGGTVDFHSHPNDNDCRPSQEDYDMMKDVYDATGQLTSKIVTPNGRITVYSRYGVIEVGTVSNKLDSSHKKALLDLFGGDKL